MSRASHSLYVHVPFCVVKCGYCDFNSYVVEDVAAHDRFLAALDAELARVWRRGDVPVSVFFGGGTPSLFTAADIDRILAGVRSRLPLSPGAEASFCPL